MATEHEAFMGAIEPLRATLEGLMASNQAMRERYNYEPAPGSKAEHERTQNLALSGEWGDLPVTASHHWTVVLLTTAEAHLRSVLDLLLLDRAVVFSTEVIGRSALELLARSIWLSSPVLDPRTRVCRWEEERLYSYRESNFIAPEQSATNRKRILATARALGITVKRGSKKSPEWLVRRPSATALVSQLMLDIDDSPIGKAIYRLHSATTHGTVYAQLLRVDSERRGTSALDRHSCRLW